MQRIRFVALGAALVLAASHAGAQQTQQGQSSAQDSSARRHGRRGTDVADARRGDRAGRQGGQPGRAMLRGITLSDAQKEQIRTINAKYKEQRQGLRKDARPEGSASRPDSAEMARFRQMNQQQQSELRAVLTPDQQATFDRNLADAREKQGKRGGRGKRGR